MATTAFFTVMCATDDATFRLWGKGLSDAFAAVGLTKRTSGEDSGQIDWATVTRPAVGVVAGYEMWRFSDVLQAIAPVLIKIEYSIDLQYSMYASYVSARVTVGFASNGAGALTGYTSTPTNVQVTASGGTTIFVHKACGASNRVSVVQGIQNTASFQVGFSVERTHTVSGDDTAEGVFVVTWQLSGPGCKYMLVAYAGGLLTTETTPSALLPSVGSGSTGTLTSFYPFFMARGPFLNPSLNMGLMFAENVTVGVRVNVTLLGATRVFYPCPFTFANRGAVAGTTLMIRDE